MKIKNFWLNNAVNKNIKEAFKKQNIKKLEEFKSLEYNIVNELNFDKHPLIISIEKKLFKNSIFFLKNYLSEDLLEEAFVFVKKTKNKEMEDLLILYCKNNSKKLEYFLNISKKNKPYENYLKKY